jgi:hypothetical protein
MDAVVPVTIALVMAVVAGALVWLLWSIVENLGAARRAKLTKNPEPNDENEAKH